MPQAQITLARASVPTPDKLPHVITHRTKVAIFGAGAYGTALAQALARAGRTAEIVLIEHFIEVVEAINARRENPRFMPGVALSPRLRAAPHASAAAGATLVILTVPTAHASAVLHDADPDLDDTIPVLVGTKGFWGDPPRRGDLAAAAAAPGHPILVMGGGALAGELGIGQATRLVIGGPPVAAELAAGLLRGPGLQVEVCDDAAGVALGAAFKNVYALGMAVAEGACGGGENWRGAYLYCAVEEMARLAPAFGGRSETLRGPAGLGDLLTTSLSPKSRNRQLGVMLSEGRPLDEAIEVLHHRPEGLDALAWLIRQPEAPLETAPLLHAIRHALLGHPDPVREFFGLPPAG